MIGIEFRMAVYRAHDGWRASVGEEHAMGQTAGEAVDILVNRLLLKIREGFKGNVYPGS